MSDAVASVGSSSSPSTLGCLRFVPPKGRYVTPFFFAVYYTKGSSAAEDGSPSFGAAAGWSAPSSSQSASLFSPYSSSPSGATEGGQTKWDPSDAIAADCTLLLSVTSTDTQEVLIPFQQAPLGRKIQLPRGHYVVKAQLLSFGGNVFAQKEATYEVLDAYEVPAHVTMSSAFSVGETAGSAHPSHAAEHPSSRRGISSSTLFEQLEAMSANGGLPPALDTLRGGRGGASGAPPSHVTSLNFASPLPRHSSAERSGSHVNNSINQSTRGGTGGGVMSERDSARVSRTGSMESGSGMPSPSSAGRPPLSRKPLEGSSGKGTPASGGDGGEADGGHNESKPLSSSISGFTASGTSVAVGTAAHGLSAASSHLAAGDALLAVPPPPRGFVVALPSMLLLPPSAAQAGASRGGGGTTATTAVEVTFALEAPVAHMGSSFRYHVLVQRERRRATTDGRDDNSSGRTSAAGYSGPILAHAQAVRRWVGIPARGVALHWDSPPLSTQQSASSAPTGRWVARGRGGAMLGVVAQTSSPPHPQQHSPLGTHGAAASVALATSAPWLTAATTSVEFFGATPREGVLSGFEFSVAPPTTEGRVLIGFRELAPETAATPRASSVSLPYVVVDVMARGGSDRGHGMQTVLSVVADGRERTHDPETHHYRHSEGGAVATDTAASALEGVTFETEVSASDVISALLEPVESAVVAGHLRDLATSSSSSSSSHVRAFFVLSVNYEVCAVVPICDREPLRHAPSSLAPAEARQQDEVPMGSSSGAAPVLQVVLAARILAVSSQSGSSSHHPPQALYSIFRQFVPVSHHRCAADVVARWLLPIPLPAPQPQQRIEFVSDSSAGRRGAEDEDAVAVYVWQTGDSLNESLKANLVVV